MSSLGQSGGEPRRDKGPCRWTAFTESHVVEHQPGKMQRSSKVQSANRAGEAGGSSFCSVKTWALFARDVAALRAVSGP